MFDVYSQDQKMLPMNLFLRIPCQAVCQTELRTHLFVHELAHASFCPVKTFITRMYVLCFVRVCPDSGSPPAV
jgi:hypothetical protein